MLNKEIIKNYCPRCQFETNHKILFIKTISYSDDYRCDYNYLMVQCSGCENISYRTDIEDFEMAYPDEHDIWHHDTETNIYPHLLKNHKPLSETWILPNKIKIVYDEAINAFMANSHLLTGVAFRAIIEAVCIDKNIKGKNLESKINNLAKGRLITENEANRLHSIRFIGNDSIHDMTVPKEKTLYIVLDIIEHLLQNLYIIDHQSKGELETIIIKYSDFIELLEKNIQTFQKSDEFPLKKILGKDVRRLGGKLSLFETELIANIKSNEYKKLSIGRIDNFSNSKDQLQFFTIN